jgi:hypothetical protein
MPRRPPARLPRALDRAARQGNIGSLLDALAAGAASAVSEADARGGTVAHLAAEYGHAEVINVLRRRGVGLNVQDMWGNSPLHHAASGGHKDVIVALNGVVDPSLRNAVGRTAFDLARHNGHDEAVTLMMGAGLDISGVDPLVCAPATRTPAGLAAPAAGARALAVEPGRAAGQPLLPHRATRHGRDVSPDYGPDRRDRIAEANGMYLRRNQRAHPMSGAVDRPEPGDQGTRVMHPGDALHAAQAAPVQRSRAPRPDVRPFSSLDLRASGPDVASHGGGPTAGGVQQPGARHAAVTYWDGDGVVFLDGVRDADSLVRLPEADCAQPLSKVPRSAIPPPDTRRDANNPPCCTTHGHGREPDLMPVHVSRQQPGRPVKTASPERWPISDQRRR